jgi:Family of unknown function (DUF6516)
VSLVDVESLREIAEVECADIVVEAIIPDINELRIILIDGSFVAVWFSLKLQGRYSFHWERRALDGKIYRHDNSTHKRWESVATFPKHFATVVKRTYRKVISAKPPRWLGGNSSRLSGPVHVPHLVALDQPHRRRGRGRTSKHGMTVPGISLW